MDTETVKHHYTQAGEYIVSLTVTDDGNLYHTSSQTIYVSAKPKKNKRTKELRVVYDKQKQEVYDRRLAEQLQEIWLNLVYGDSSDEML